MELLIMKLKSYIEREKRINKPSSFLSDYENGYRAGAIDQLDSIERIVKEVEEHGPREDV